MDFERPATGTRCFSSLNQAEHHRQLSLPGRSQRRRNPSSNPLWGDLSCCSSNYGSMATDTPIVDTKFVLHYSSVMKNVTITLEDDIAHWARVRAAELNTSVSRLLGEMLRDLKQREDRYQAAMKQYLSQKPEALKRSDKKYPSREELHDRTHLR